MDAQDAYGADAFTANIGAEAIRDMLAQIDLEAEAEQLRRSSPRPLARQAQEDRQAAQGGREPSSRAATGPSG